GDAVSAGVRSHVFARWVARAGRAPRETVVAMVELRTAQPASRSTGAAGGFALGARHRPAAAPRYARAPGVRSVAAVPRRDDASGRGGCRPGGASDVRSRAGRKAAVREALITAWRNRAPKRLAEQVDRS